MAGQYQVSSQAHWLVTSAPDGIASFEQQDVTDAAKAFGTTRNQVSHLDYGGRGLLTVEHSPDQKHTLDRRHDLGPKPQFRWNARSRSKARSNPEA